MDAKQLGRPHTTECCPVCKRTRCLSLTGVHQGSVERSIASRQEHLQGNATGVGGDDLTGVPTTTHYFSPVAANCTCSFSLALFGGDARATVNDHGKCTVFSPVKVERSGRMTECN